MAELGQHDLRQEEVSSRQSKPQSGGGSGINENRDTTTNRYAHLVSSYKKSGDNRSATAVSKHDNIAGTKPNNYQQANNNLQNANLSSSHQFHHPNIQHHNQQPTGAEGQRQAYANYYYNSFSMGDWREQWRVMKTKIMDRAEEPENQRKLILIIVCCALLLDNMLYMVIVPIIPDYLRSIGAWSTYTENAEWVRRNTTRGGFKWERVGGQVVYEGEDSAVGFLFASKAIVQLFINPFSGAIIDRIGYEIPMMIGLVVMFFSTMVFACGQTYSVLFLARSLQGVGSAFADTAGLAMIADRFSEENERQRALGIALAFISFGCLVAPPFGSVLYQAAGKEVPFIVLSLVCLLDGSLLLLVTPPGTFNFLYSNHNEYHSQPSGHRETNYRSVRANGDEPTMIAQKQRGNFELSNLDEHQPSHLHQQQTSPDQRKQQMLRRQKSISRRHSITTSAGEAPKGTPIYVLFRNSCIACCSGALVVANVSLAFLEPTISIWMQNTMPDIEEWQIGMIWLPAFIPHVLGVYSTVKLANKYPRYQWLIAAIGLILEGLSCLMVPFCSSFWSLIIPISIICFGVALIDTAILPTLGYLVDTRFVSVYGSIYAIADISYSLSYAVGPVIAGGIVESIGFTALNFLIAIVTLGYTPVLMMLRSIHDYEPFEADSSGLRTKEAKESAPFGKFGRRVSKSYDQDDEQNELDNSQSAADGSGCPNPTRYEAPRWAAASGWPEDAKLEDPRSSPAAAATTTTGRPAAIKTSSFSSSPEASGRRKPKRHTVKIVEHATWAEDSARDRDQDSSNFPSLSSPTDVVADDGGEWAARGGGSEGAEGDLENLQRLRSERNPFEYAD